MSSAVRAAPSLYTSARPGPQDPDDARAQRGYTRPFCGSGVTFRLRSLQNPVHGRRAKEWIFRRQSGGCDMPLVGGLVGARSGGPHWARDRPSLCPTPSRFIDCPFPRRPTDIVYWRSDPGFRQLLCALEYSVASRIPLLAVRILRVRIPPSHSESLLTVTIPRCATGSRWIRVGRAQNERLSL